MNSGGGGSSQPTQQTTQQSSVPSYVQPYVENVLGRTAALTDINQNPYQPYQGKQVADFGSLQNQAQSEIGSLGTPAQFAMGTNLAQQGGQGFLTTPSQALGYGATGAGYGASGAGIGNQATYAGQNYQNMATSPQAMQAYMNPYVQQSLQPQLQLLNQQQAIQGQDINAKATGQGAFGGNRATLAQGLNAQNFDLARQQAVAQGYDTAFKNAQQAQQFGANLGLQGLQTGIQGQQAGMQGAQVGLQGISGAQAGYQGAVGAGSALGNIGSQQSQSDLARISLMNQMGGQQQAQEQAQLNVPYQQYQENLNYPYKQLAFQQGMFSGLPMSQSAQTMYQQQPNTGQQALGLGLGALGAYRAFA